ncbi:DUF134 domain-containing protein [Flavonifractor sp. An100]|uniref:DUF134 domain-containing protein n=1 Tax=Flavonifractor sp. An100 TaxID=1965538 RepID=UPI000B3761AF|nr:DUF134 domain-containing protein [Flavonifractor sp. An100]OUQ80251.1 hypothetical protein B5E43_04805 [Flavonifractor sp. An100]
MARPKKCRRICGMPQWEEFLPASGGDGQVVMTVDEFESIRLIDWEGMTQEQCASQMMVARATAASIYESARRKLADVLVHGRMLTITGGEVTVCQDSQICCGRCGQENCRRCGRPCGHRCQRSSVEEEQFKGNEEIDNETCSNL